MHTTLFRPRQAVVSAALLVVAALALAACGGTGSGAADPSSTPTTTTSGGASSFAAYTTCLKNHGVNLPNFQDRGNGTPPANPPSGQPPQNGGGGFGGNLTDAQRQAFQAAQTACASLRPQGGGFFGRGQNGGGGFNSQAFAAYRNCLTLHGVKLTRPQPGAAPAAPTAKMRAAQQACAALRPSGFGRPPSSSGSNSQSS